MPTKTDSKTATKAPKATAAQKEQARKARAGARIAKEKQTKATATPKAQKTTEKPSNITTANRSDLAGTGGVNFRAADFINGDIWKPDDRIPAIDEATYESWKTQAQGQARSIEVASLNMKNIDSLHKLEGQAADISITAKNTETKWAKLEGAEIAYQTQLQVNGEASQKLTQATESHQMAERETGYRRELIGLKDQNFQLEIEQARTMFSEKSARYRAQLSGN